MVIVVLSLVPLEVSTLEGRLIPCRFLVGWSKAGPLESPFHLDFCGISVEHPSRDNTFK